MEWRKAGGKLLHERRVVEKAEAQKRERERRKSEHRAYIEKARQQGGYGGYHFSSVREESGLFDVVSSVIGKLFM